MSDYDRILLSTRHAELERFVRHHEMLREARRGMAPERRSVTAGLSSVVRGLRGLRLGARRSLKGRRSLA